MFFITKTFCIKYIRNLLIFSGSTLLSEGERGLGSAASINLSLNFLAEVRTKAQGNSHRGSALKAVAR